MVFIDGTNLLYRLAGARLTLTKPLMIILKAMLGRRQLQRAYFYTSQPHLDRAMQVHSEVAFQELRIVLGQAIPLSDGNYKEKGVDALLVADLIYHAAVRNFDFAVLLSADTDFVHAIERVEDFGCRTSVVSLCAPLPTRLRSATDEAFQYTADDLIRLEIAKITEAPA